RTASAAAAPSTPSTAPRPEETRLAADLLAALGGAANVRAVQTCASRVRVDFIDAAAGNDKALQALRVRGLARPEGHVLHRLVGPRGAAVAAGMAVALD